MTTELAQQSAAMCKDYFDALVDVGFTSEQAGQIVAAWVGRPAPITDMAAMNAVMQNFADRFQGGAE